MTAKKYLYPGLLVASIAAASSVLVFSKDTPAPSGRATASPTTADHVYMDEEEGLEAMIAHYRANMENFSPAEGEITTYEQLNDYLKSLPQNTTKLEDGEITKELWVEP